MDKVLKRYILVKLLSVNLSVKKKVESRTIASIEIVVLKYVMKTLGGGGVHGSFFAGYVQLTSQNLCRTLTYFVANYRPHLCLLLSKIGMEWEPFIKYYKIIQIVRAL